MRSGVVLITGLLWVLVFSPVVFGLEGSFIFQPVSATLGWWPYVCVAEKGVYGESFNKNYCDARECPFEAAAFLTPPDWYGQNFGSINTCNGEGILLATCGELVSITIPSVEDIILVNSEGFIVRDAVCKGDKIKIKSGIAKGEYWDKGGTEDSPPIYWVDDFDKFFDEVMKYHEDTVTDLDKITSEELPSDGKDKLFGVPFHKHLYTHGGLVCGIDSGPVASSGTDSEGEYYVVTGTDTMTLSSDTIIKCTFFYEQERGRHMEGYVIRVPSIVGYELYNKVEYQYGNIGNMCLFRGTSTVNRKEYYSKDDLFRIGAIEINKTLKILPSNPEPVIGIKSFVTDDVLYEDEETIVRILIENEGKTSFEVKELIADVEYEFLGCDCDVLDQGEVGECLINIKPSRTVFVNIGLDYEYSRCGADIHSRLSSQMKEIKIKVNSCSKSEDCVKGYVCCMKTCRNSAKGVCDDVDGDGWFEWSYY